MVDIESNTLSKCGSCDVEVAELRTSCDLLPVPDIMMAVDQAFSDVQTSVERKSERRKCDRRSKKK